MVEYEETEGARETLAEFNCAVAAAMPKRKRKK